MLFWIPAQTVGLACLLLLSIGVAVPNLLTRRYKTRYYCKEAQDDWHEFKAPRPKPYAGWSIEATKPLPYRPFKHKYFITMGIQSMDLDDWIELDNDWPKFHKIKLERLASANGQELYSAEPGPPLDAAEELLEYLVNYLPHRYPSLFERTNVGIKNLYTDEEFDTISRPWQESPIVISSKLVQEDLLIMLEGEDGLYYLRGGGLIVAGFWRLKDKINMSLDEIHLSGGVPQFKEKLQTSMNRYFSRLRPDKPVVRNSYFFQLEDDKLEWSKAIGTEDSNDLGWHNSRSIKDPSEVFYRTERQSLLRLPRTKAIIFSIRTYIEPLNKLMQEPHVPRRLYNGILSWEPKIAAYKGLHKYKDALLPYLLEHCKQQEAQGIVEENERSNYPW